MGLADIAAGIEVTDTQDARGVATVDDTDATLAERLEPFASALPCSVTAAATVLERYAACGSVGAAGRAADVAPMTAAKTLYLLGESVSPATPLQRDVLADWHAGDLSRREAIELTGLSETEFALAAYVETHDPIEEACAAVEGVLAGQALDETEPLADAVGDERGF
ncbi:hypothetical protein SAMN05216226_107135 [Halovenus aranensis]|uniref:Uncharacterized protein n=1 Tax=Halovenus aranensis TaxID=890420 RepID=A0A1G8VSF0_9EURY|nr:hypothetical protein [Halovenus aranensis]SDJ69011.1 hypothetical protein SAMN05216226_107135 [Halovenus aranensis]